MTVAANLLCITIPEEPPGIPADIGVPPPPNATQRQRYEQHESNRSLQRLPPAHGPAGVRLRALHLRRHLARHRQWTAGRRHGRDYTTDAAGKFDGAIEDEARRPKPSRQGLLRRQVDPIRLPARTQCPAGCARQKLRETFAQSNFNVPELLVSLTQTDAFLYRPSGPAAP